jgi:hypothetical protein
VKEGDITGAQKPTVSKITVADWLDKLDSTLNTDPFLDLAGSLRALQPADYVHKQNPFAALEYKQKLFAAVEAVARAQNLIDGMLKQQVKQQVRP